VLSISPTYLLYYLPLIVTISLVFGGTRHEDTTIVIQRAWQTGRWITSFMLVIFAVLCLMAWLI
jgi:Ca2+/H+ antiporter